MANVVLITTGLILPGSLQAMLKDHKLTTLVHETGFSSRLADTAADVLLLEWDHISDTALIDCRTYRLTGGNLPLLMVSTRGGGNAVEAALRAGADDFMTLPVNGRELSCRISALLRRNKTFQFEILKFGSLTLDTMTNSISSGNIRSRLFPRDFSVLEFMVRYHGHAHCMNDLAEIFAPAFASSATAALRKSVMRIRTNLLEIGSNVTIENVHGKGYRIVKRANSSISMPA